MSRKVCSYPCCTPYWSSHLTFLSIFLTCKLQVTPTSLALLSLESTEHVVSNTKWVLGIFSTVFIFYIGKFCCLFTAQTILYDYWKISLTLRTSHIYFFNRYFVTVWFLTCGCILNYPLLTEVLSHYSLPVIT